MDLERLPGGNFVKEGLADLAAGLETPAACLVSIGATRLGALGLSLPGRIPSPELRLYALLQAEDAPTAHGRYNALVRRLVSFEEAAECAA